MEVEGEDGSKTVLQNGDKTVFGRGLGFNTKDNTVSRRHVVFEAKSGGSQTGSKFKLSFEVVGKNPMWVREHGSGNIRVFMKGDKGDVVAGDWLCFLSWNKPVWFAVKECGIGEREKRVLESENGLAENLGSGVEFDGVDADVLDIDPVKEFGFLVMGHEFDHYPKQMIRDIKNWDWFLEEPKRDSNDDAYLEKRGKRGVMKRRRKAEGNDDDDDDDFTGESDDDKELVTKLRKVERPKYSTRSKDRDKPPKEAKGGTSSLQKKTSGANDDSEDETLGGFIVDDEDMEQEEENDEEELVEDDDDEEVDD